MGNTFDTHENRVHAGISTKGKGTLHPAVGISCVSISGWTVPPPCGDRKRDLNTRHGIVRLIAHFHNKRLFKRRAGGSLLVFARDYLERLEYSDGFGIKRLLFLSPRGQKQ